jgi:hypothetical protein
MDKDTTQHARKSAAQAQNISATPHKTTTNPLQNEEPIQEGTFVNIETGEMRAYFANPPTTNKWRLLSHRLDMTLEDAKRIVGQGGYAPLDPAMLHF